MITKERKDYDAAYYLKNRPKLLANAKITDEVRRRERGCKVRIFKTKAT
jgi:ribosomal protein L21